MEQVNPQQAVRYAYAAGLIDGEGTIRVQRSSASTRGSQYLPHIHMTSTDAVLVNFMKEPFGGWIYSHQPKSARGSTINCNIAYRWALQGRENVLHMMKAIEPYVLLKANHVALMLEFLEEGEKTHPPYPVSDAEVARRTRIFEQFKSLNRRGRAAAETEWNGGGSK